MTLSVNMVKLEMSSALSALGTYYNMVARSHEEIVSQEVRLTVEELEASPDDEFQFSEDSVREDIEKDFREILNYSMIIMLNDRIEVYLKRLVQNVKDDIQARLSYSDFQGTPIEKTSLFLIATKRPEIPTEARNFFGLISAVRNCIVHANGRMEDQNQKSARIIESNARHYNLKFPAGKLRVPNAFVEAALVRAKELLLQIFNDQGRGWNSRMQ